MLKICYPKGSQERAPIIAPERKERMALSPPSGITQVGPAGKKKFPKLLQGGKRKPKGKESAFF